MNRRDLLKAGVAGLGAMALTPHVSGADARPIRVGLIGSGWYGKLDLFRLIQIAPVEVVSISDVDKKMLEGAADLISQRQISKKKPRTHTSFRDQLKEKDIDLCIIGTPDHWHALNAIAAMEAGCDLYLQKPISVDVLEGKAILESARKLNRVVQIGTQRRSTPHLIDARDKVIKPGLLGNIAYVEICCYYHMRNRSNAPDENPPEHLDFDAWTGPAPLRPFNKIMHPRGWRAFMEYGNGIVGDMCVHMLDMVRWMLDLGWPKAISSTGGILVQKETKANISDTQEASFDFGDLKVVWTHRTWGSAPDPKYPWAAFIYGDKGTLKASVNAWDFFPQGAKEPKMSGEPLFEYEKYPEDKTEKDLERHVASAIRWHFKDLLACIEQRGKKLPVADVEQGYISTASCVLANMAMKLGRVLRFDPATATVPGDAEATALLKRPYRQGYTHPAG